MPVYKIDPGLDFSYRAFDEAHAPLAMAALVRRRRKDARAASSADKARFTLP
jgi:hypothetical protein